MESMRYDVFDKAAQNAYAAIPEVYKSGVDGLVVSAEAPVHPLHDGVYTLGECQTESYPSDWSGPETTRSVVVLYHGSFQALAASDPGFDWQDELWETLTHELRHHLESLADEDQLVGVDYVMDEGFKRADGMDFDPWYYQRGDRIGAGVYRAEEHVFIEQTWTAADFDRAEEVTFRWQGRMWRIPRPGVLGDVHYVWIDGAPTGGGTIQLVLVRKRSWRDGVRALLAGPNTDVELWESEAKARAT